jgi:hypothetical protein
LAADALLGTAAATERAAAADLSAADLAWIDRKIEQSDEAAQILRIHAADRRRQRAFTVSELEWSYPPAHAMCHDQSDLG